MSSLVPPAVILNEPQLAENIGAVARAMGNFGLTDLRLVRPRDGWPQERAWASASGATWPLEGARVFATLEEALGDLQLVLATTARPRETQLTVEPPRAAAQRLAEAAGQGLATGLLFGGERAGLETADIALCHGIVTIPVDPKFWSLNLAQSVVVCAYEWRLASAGEAQAARALDPPAPMREIVGLYEHLEAELEAGGFFYPPEKRASMVRNLRVALGRARFTEQETATLRGVITALARGRGRVLAKLAEQRARRGEEP
jgi:tRNA/rRNA methyltransferase